MCQRRENVFRWRGWKWCNPKERYLPSLLENVEKQDNGRDFPPTAQTSKNVGLVIFCTECKKPRLLHSKYKLKNQQPAAAKRIVQKLEYICWASLSEYYGSCNDRDEGMLKIIFVRANLSCASKVEFPYYPRVCIYCGMTGTNRTLNSSVEYYPKCNDCSGQPDVAKRKSNNLVMSDFHEKRKK